MNTALMGSYSTEILQSLGAISNNENALARVAKYLRKVVKEQTSDPTLLSEEDFFAMLDRSEEEARQGKVYRMAPNETLSDFLDRVG